MATKDKISIKLGDPFLSLLSVLFIGLKLTGYIAWPWYWVLAPIWIPVAVALLGLLILIIATIANK